MESYSNPATVCAWLCLSHTAEELRGGVAQFRPAPQTPPARQIRQDSGSHDGSTYITLYASQRAISSIEAYRLIDGAPPPSQSELLPDTGAYPSLPPSDRLLSSGCGSSTSVQPSFLLNNEVVCPFLCVSGSLTCSIGIPGSLESLESTSGQGWYHRNPEQQC